MELAKRGKEEKCINNFGKKKPGIRKMKNPYNLGSISVRCVSISLEFPEEADRIKGFFYHHHHISKTCMFVPYIGLCQNIVCQDKCLINNR